MKNFEKQSGQISKIVLILAGVIVVLVIIIFVAIRIVGSRNADKNSKNETLTEATEPPEPVYETTIGNIKFVLQSSLNLGSVLKSTTTYQQDLKTTERFIRVAVGAQNKGKNEIPAFSWELGNIVDSDGRNFMSIDNQAYHWLPNPNFCGALLKPEFDPVPCVKIYEVSKLSENLKVEVIAAAPNSSRKQKMLIDLNVIY